MTPTDRARLRELLAAASHLPNPCVAEESPRGDWCLHTYIDPGDGLPTELAHGLHEEDAALLAMLWEEAPALLDDLDRLERERDEARAIAEKLTAAVNAGSDRIGKDRVAMAMAEDAMRVMAEKHDALRSQVEALRAERDGAYLERNRLVQLLTALYPSGIRHTRIEGWDPVWDGCVYVDLPTGQASWHYHETQAHLFSHLPAYAKPYDGHTTEEKYERISALTAARAKETGDE